MYTITYNQTSVFGPGRVGRVGRVGVLVLQTSKTAGAVLLRTRHFDTKPASPDTGRLPAAVAVRPLLTGLCQTFGLAILARPLDEHAWFAALAKALLLQPA